MHCDLNSCYFRPLLKTCFPRMKLNCDEQLTKFAFNRNLRRYIKELKKFLRKHKKDRQNAIVIELTGGALHNSVCEPVKYVWANSLQGDLLIPSVFTPVGASPTRIGTHCLKY